jgi:hypothetical protein
MSRPKKVFRSFSEWYTYSKRMNDEDQQAYFLTLPKEMRKKIQQSFLLGGWSDLVYRDKTDRVIDNLTDTTGINILEIRASVLSKKNPTVARMPRGTWLYIFESLMNFGWQHIEYALGGLHAADTDDPEFVLIVKE